MRSAASHTQPTRRHESSARNALPIDFERAIRLAFFATVADEGEDVLALGVTPDRVLAHLDTVLEGANLKLAVAELLHLGDVALACACIDDRDDAWLLLEQRAERILIRAGSAFETETHPAVRARQLLHDVRVATRTDENVMHNLRRYAGDARLCGWLVERLMASIARDLASRGSKRAALRRSADRIEVTLRLLREQSLLQHASSAETAVGV
ncbi:MAG: hypothetical protein ACYTF7_11730 [Planctomycetota bacterium]|jgi:hypothetical protein